MVILMDKINFKKIKMVFEVAKWEFNRWFKLKEQLITILVGALLSLLIFGGKTIFDKITYKKIEVALINQSTLQIELNKETKIKLIPKEIGELNAQKNLLNEKKIEGILLIDSLNNISLTVQKDYEWIKEINSALNKSFQQIKIKESGITTEQLQNIFEPIDIKMIYTAQIKEKSTTSEKVAAGVFIAVTLIGIFLGLAYQFVAITGEKQLRITEVIISAISPQTWIDGKILGISLLSLVLLITFSFSSIIFVLISGIFGSALSIPIVLANPSLIIFLFLFSITGFMFWNTFFAAIAATINDPNTSARGSLMMVPIIPVVIAFTSFSNPDSLIIKILSYFPITSVPVISVRMVLTEVSIVELLISLLLLIASTWYLRKAAGKIFSLSVLMYGKEPSWKEISKWLKQYKK